ncbi:MAG: PepSY-associated TM helix domain-containing protein [Balneolaceae bacterium]|nr:PepSY-associated TM helix domain-containing protein [Balneolaceae bacterium]
MNWNTRRDSRKLHRWGAILTALPFLIVIISGILLQVKKEFSWIQPPSHQGSIINETPAVSFEDILLKASSVDEADISDWEDVDRLDVHPDDGIVKVRSNTGWELQIDLGTGELLHSQRRRSDVIESMHDGSWFFEGAKLWIFLPSAIIVAILWITGIYLFFLPYFAKRQNRRRMIERRIRRSRRKKRNSNQESEFVKY